LFGGVHDGASPYEVELLIRDGAGGALGYSKSQVYKQVKVLAASGYLSPRTLEGKTRPKTYYSLTDKGLDAVRAWLRTRARAPKLDDSEAFIRIRALRLAHPSVVLEGLLEMRLELEDRADDLRQGQRRMKAKGHWDTAAALEFDLQRAKISAYLGWLDRVEDELAPVR